MTEINTGLVKDEIPVVRKKFSEARRAGKIKLATGFASILADLEILESDNVERFIIFSNGTIQGVEA